MKQEKTVLVSTRLERASKTTCVNRIVGIMSDLNDSLSQEANDQKKKRQSRIRKKEISVFVM